MTVETIWEVKKRKYDDIIKQLLFNRGIRFNTEKEIEKFIEPDFERDLFDPYLINGIQDAVDRIQKAQKNNETVGIFADYDADGIPGAALLHRALKKIGIESVTYIPTREGGYGLSNEGIDYLIAKKCDLIITVDLGIRNFLEAEYCREKNIDLIITDHHLPDDKIPQADIVINSKIKGSKYHFPDLAGCGVAYKLVSALKKVYPKKITENFLKWNLDLVAISTIADVVPLTGENRVLAKYGLIVLRKTKNMGLLALYKVANIDPDKINAYVTGFGIAPRINAPGRMDHATKSFELLVTEDEKEATELAKWLNDKNIERRLAMDETGKEAIEKICEEKLENNNIIIVCGKWIKGVIGPTASQLVEKYSRPVILFCQDENKLVGSARSVSGVNIVEIFEKAKKYIEKYGGHKGAAGLTVARNKFSDFLAKIIEVSGELIDPKALTKKIKIDAEILPNEIAINLCKKIEKFEPFGMGNPKPVFSMTNTKMSNFKLVGKGQNHLSLSVEKDDKILKSIFFGIDKEKVEKLNNHTMYDVAFSLLLDQWNDKEYVKLNVVDIKPHI